MLEFVQQLKTLFYRLLFALLIFSASRTALYYFNQDMFDGFGFYIWFVGLRFDLVSLLIFNIPIILLSLIPGPLFYKNWYKNLVSVLFILSNTFLVGANLTDAIYYRFTFKRSTFDVFDIFANDSEMWWLIPKFILDFWYITLLFLVFVLMLYYFIKKTPNNYKFRNTHSYKYLAEISISILILLATILGIRGGFQLRPLGIIDANTMVESKNIHLILNTPFTLIKTIGKQKLENKNYFTEDELIKIYNPYFAPKKEETFNKKNVVILIMESLSAEFCGCLNPGKISYTPFFDSLSTKGYLAMNCFANGKKSIDGIPAILSGFPSLMNNPYISSAYSSNQLGSIADALKSEGYCSAFFHGGNNGTMGFDNFVKSIGFEAYIGRNEYNNDDDFDGKWGIFDVPFFHFINSKIQQFKEPFAVAIFSLSAHHPYTLPQEYSTTFKAEKLPILACIRYSDYALQSFFDYAKTQDWYNNTLFIITADHTAENSFSHNDSRKNNFSIPLLFFSPSDTSLTGKTEKITQQIDILPSILDYLNYPNSYFCFGKSLFDEQENGFSIAFKNNNYLWKSQDVELDFTNENSFKSTSIDSNKTKAEVKKLKAFIQLYNKSLNENKLKIKT